MNTNISNRSLLTAIFPVIATIIACVSIGIISVMLDSTYILYGIGVILLLAFAIILPIQQKHFSFYSIILVVCSILFIVSGAIDYAYHTVVKPLPVISQIEFSKIMRPSQVSRGLTNVAFGMLYMALSFFGFQKATKLEKPKGSVLKFFLCVMVIAGILYSTTGIDSIVKGLHKL